MGKSRFFLLFLMFLFVLISCSKGFYVTPGEGGRRTTFSVPQENPLIRLDYPADWKIDISQDYCDLIAFGPDDIYSIVTVEELSGEGLEAYIRKFFHAFSFYEDFTVREERVFSLPSLQGRKFLYSYRETARNQEFTEWTVFLKAESRVIVVQYTAPGEKFSRYQALFQELSGSIRLPDMGKEGAAH